MAGQEVKGKDGKGSVNGGEKPELRSEGIAKVLGDKRDELQAKLREIKLLEEELARVREKEGEAKVNEKAQRLSREVEQLRGEVREYEEKYTDARGAVKIREELAEKQLNAIGELTTKIDKLEGRMTGDKGYEKRLTDLEAEVGKLRRGIEDGNLRDKGITERLKELHAKADELNAAAEAFKTEKEGTKQEAEKATANMRSEFDKLVSEIWQKVNAEIADAKKEAEKAVAGKISELDSAKAELDAKKQEYIDAINVIETAREKLEGWIAALEAHVEDMPALNEIVKKAKEQMARLNSKESVERPAPDSSEAIQQVQGRMAGITVPFPAPAPDTSEKATNGATMLGFAAARVIAVAPNPNKANEDELPSEDRPTIEMGTGPSKRNLMDLIAANENKLKAYANNLASLESYAIVLLGNLSLSELSAVELVTQDPTKHGNYEKVQKDCRIHFEGIVAQIVKVRINDKRLVALLDAANRINKELKFEQVVAQPERTEKILFETTENATEIGVHALEKSASDVKEVLAEHEQIIIAIDSALTKAYDSITTVDGA